jgi:galactose mutarotase-like enzyme
MSGTASDLYQSVYKGMPSYAAENGHIRVEMVPELGGKLVSLLHKETGKEWLLDSGARPLRTPAYGSSFADWDMSGWDECFPTIDGCEVGEDGSTRLPDHGELWSVPWEVEVVGGVIAASVAGRQLPYRFSRTLELTGDRTLTLGYEAHNTGSAPFDFLWAAHPQFNVDEPTAILLPEGMRELQCVFGGRALEAGAGFEAPEPWIVDPALDGNGLKFYYPGSVNEGWSGLCGLNTGNRLYVRTDREKVPYLGIWIDKGMYNDRTTIALEPGIGYYDSLARASRNGTAIKLMPGERYRWRLELELEHDGPRA